MNLTEQSYGLNYIKKPSEKLVFKGAWWCIPQEYVLILRTAWICSGRIINRLLSGHDYNLRFKALQWLICDQNSSSAEDVNSKYAQVTVVNR